MSQYGHPHKKVVSKSKYVQVQFLRVGVGLAALCLLFMATVGGVLTIKMFQEFLNHPDWQVKNYGGFLLPRVLSECGGAMLAGFGVYKAYRMSISTLTKAKQKSRRSAHESERAVPSRAGQPCTRFR